MARNAYSGDKRRREVAKKKKREEKLARKQHRGDEPEGEANGESPAEEQDLSYLEYLYPGGVPEELLPKSEDDTDEDGNDEEEGEDKNDA